MTVVVVAVVVVLLGYHLVAFKQPHAQQERQGHLPLHRSQDAGIGFDCAELVFEGGEPLFFHQVALVQQQHVAVHDLGPGHLALQQLIAEVFGIHQGDDRIEAGLIAQITAKEGHRHGQGIGQARGFHHQVVDRIRPIENAIHGFEQFAVDGATDAAVAQLHHVLAGGHHQVVVDADFAELVDEHGGFQPLLIAEDVVEQGGFAGSQKAGEDRDR